MELPRYFEAILRSSSENRLAAIPDLPYLNDSPYFSMTYAPFIAFFDRSAGIFALSLPS